MKKLTAVRPDAYAPPTLRVIGSVAELTLGCYKNIGSADGFMFHGNFHGRSIFCTSP
jgi:hypothetical protein